MAMIYDDKKYTIGWNTWKVTSLRTRMLVCLLLMAASCLFWIQTWDHDYKIIFKYKYLYKGEVLNTNFDWDLASRTNNGKNLHLAFFIRNLPDRLGELEVAMRTLTFSSANYCNIHLHFITDRVSKYLITKFFEDNPNAKQYYSFHFQDIGECKVPLSFLRSARTSKAASLLKAVPQICLPADLDEVVVMDFDLMFLSNACGMVDHPDLQQIFDPGTNIVVGIADEAIRHSHDAPHISPLERNGFNSGVIVFNLKKAREIDFLSLFFKELDRWNEKFPGYPELLFQDQDAFNRVNYITDGENFIRLPQGFNIQFTGAQLFFEKNLLLDDQRGVIQRETAFILHAPGQKFHYPRALSSVFFLFSSYSHYYLNSMPKELLEMNESEKAYIRDHFLHYCLRCSQGICDYKKPVPTKPLPPYAPKSKEMRDMKNRMLRELEGMVGWVKSTPVNR